MCVKTGQTGQMSMGGVRVTLIWIGDRNPVNPRRHAGFCYAVCRTRRA